MRREWKRLYDSYDFEKKKAENAGCRIEIDKRKRQITRDGQVIDKWLKQSSNEIVYVYMECEWCSKQNDIVQMWKNTNDIVFININKNNENV